MQFRNAVAWSDVANSYLQVRCSSHVLHPIRADGGEEAVHHKISDLNTKLIRRHLGSPLNRLSEIVVDKKIVGERKKK
ncbi:hypothetical protein L6452_09476 [Arctium lappa]|uniref:Uncharacterized protein n=1 Tax=Arctium lappa TaxID=4217 RepID=A0ACB9DK63_ARCLA|nr:hypothetical protein L6452_09476 [Arctium lappa]